MPDAPEFTNDPSPEALRYFRNKGLRPSFNWAEVWAEEHAHAFTVAKATELDLLATIRNAVDDALAKGQTFEDFSKALTPKLQRFGWWGRQFVLDPETGEEVLAQLGSPARLKLIYNANIRTAHAAGQWDRAQRTKAVLPFFIYIETVSREPREEHLAQVGTIAPVDDPYWETWFPPNGYNCKCSVRQITRSEAEQRGWNKDQVIPPWPTKPYRNKRTGTVDEIPVGIDPGWHRNPARTRFVVLDEYLSGRFDDIEPAMRAVAFADLTSNWMFRRLSSGEFYSIAAPAKTPKIAVPVGYIDPDLRKLTGQKSGVVWLTPEKPFVLKNPPPELWQRVPTVIAEGAVVRAKTGPGQLIFYREIDGRHFRVEIATRDAWPGGDTLKGSRLDLQFAQEIDAQTAKFELNFARQDQRLIREARPISDIPVIRDPEIKPISGLSPPPIRPGDRQTLILDSGEEIIARHIKPRGSRGLRQIVLENGGARAGELNYSIVNASDGRKRVVVEYVNVRPEYRRKGVATALYDRLEAWATEEGLLFGPSEKLMDDGFAFWKARVPSHPRLLADLRNYRERLVEYAVGKHGAGVEIDVDWEGRAMRVLRLNSGVLSGLEVLENVSYEQLAKTGIVPVLPAHRY